jgi:hypothetical protein
MRKLALALSFAFLLTIAASAQNAKPTPTPAPSPSPSPSPSAVNLTGKWAVVADAGGQAINILMDIKQTGTEFTGVTESDIGGGKIDGGKVTGNKFVGVLHADVQGQSADFKIEGTLDGEKMTGTFTNAGFGSVPFSGGKAK